jgi:hypothetical protein
LNFNIRTDDPLNYEHTLVTWNENKLSRGKVTTDVLFKSRTFNLKQVVLELR